MECSGPLGSGTVEGLEAPDEPTPSKRPRLHEYWTAERMNAIVDGLKALVRGRLGSSGPMLLFPQEGASRPQARHIVRNRQPLEVIIQACPHRVPPVQWLANALKRLDDFWDNRLSAARSDQEANHHCVTEAINAAAQYGRLRKLKCNAPKSRNKASQGTKRTPPPPPPEVHADVRVRTQV